jgi:hypothetical protein
MAKAHMTALYWYQTELDKLIKVGYASGEAHKILKDRLATMDSIEWLEPTNNLTVLLDNEEAL